MMKLKNWTAIILSIFLMLFPGVTVSATNDSCITNDEYGVPDENLYNYLVREADLNGDGVIQLIEANEITEVAYNVDFESGKVYSLKGLSLFKNLKVIYMPFNCLSSLNGIEGLELTHIYVNNNDIADISAISVMGDTLRILNVAFNELETLPDMSMFEKLYNDPYMRTTDFSDNKIPYEELYSKLPEHLKVCSDFDFWVRTQTPVENPTEVPTEAPTEEPTVAPTEEPTVAPTEEPTVAPTETPTEAPTEAPTETPTEAPTEEPTVAPTETPTEAPTEAPTETPTEAPTEEPTVAPTEAPTKPTDVPTQAPTVTPATSSSSTTTTTTGGKVAAPVVNTGEEAMKSILVAILLAATTAVFVTRKKRLYN